MSSTPITSPILTPRLTAFYFLGKTNQLRRKSKHSVLMVMLLMVMLLMLLVVMLVVMLDGDVG